MLQEENSHEATPKEACQPTDHKRYYKGQRHPHPEGVTDKDNYQIFHQVTTVHVGISLPVSQRMMLEVRRCPLNCRSLCRHAAKNEKDSLYNRVGPEAAVGQHAMVANSHARYDGGVHYCQERKI